MHQENLIGKTCLVTGANGFIGSKLCSELIRCGAKVKKLVRTVDVGSSDDCFACNLGEQKVPDQAMREVDIIFHLAGRTHSLADSNAQESLYFKANVDGTRALLEAANKAGIKKFIYFSSVKSMGEESDIRLDENSRSQPLTAYGKSKKEAEDLVLQGNYVEQPTVLRLVMVYGDISKGNLPKLIKAISSNKFPPFPKIENKRSMIHVEDVLHAAILVATTTHSAGQTYILSDGVDYSTRKLYERIRQSIGKTIPDWGVSLGLLKLIAKVGDIAKIVLGKRVIFDSDNLQKLIGNSYYSSEKIKAELGFVPKYNLYVALPEIITELNEK